MKVKPNQEILFYDGTPMVDEKNNPVLLRDAIVNSINTVDPKSEEQVDKAKVFEISMKMYKEDKEVELSMEDRTFILKRAQETLIPVVYGRLKEILET
jgi:hypothetical protein